jgi:hypothetical protein
MNDESPDSRCTVMTGADHVVQQNVVAIAIVGYQRRQVHLQDPWLQAENGYSHI